MKKTESFLFVAVGMILVSSVAFSNPRETKSFNSGLQAESKSISTNFIDPTSNQNSLLPTDNLVMLVNIPRGKMVPSSNELVFKAPVDSVVRREKTSSFNIESMLYPAPGKDMSTGKTFAKKINYPEQAINDGISGEVKVLCTIETNGSVTGIKVLNDIGGDCAMAVVNALKTTKFQPAVKDGKAVRCTVILPVLFDLR